MNVPLKDSPYEASSDEQAADAGDGADEIDAAHGAREDPNRAVELFEGQVQKEDGNDGDDWDESHADAQRRV